MDGKWGNQHSTFGHVKLKVPVRHTNRNADEILERSSLKFKGDTGAKDKTFKVISTHDIKL